VLAITTKHDLFELTSGIRARRGPVHVFNPQGAGNVASTVRWNPLEGCQDPATAHPPRQRVSPSARLATWITPGVDARLRQLALLRHRRISHVLDERALVIRGGYAPVIARLPMAWKAGHVTVLVTGTTGPLPGDLDWFNDGPPQ
jgi:hypothetical protein